MLAAARKGGMTVRCHVIIQLLRKKQAEAKAEIRAPDFITGTWYMPRADPKVSRAETPLSII